MERSLLSSDILTQLGLILFLILFNAFLAASEMAIVSVRKSRIKQMADDGNKSARMVLRVADNTSRFLATIQIGVTLSGMFAASVGAVSLVVPLSNMLRQSSVPFLASNADAIVLFVVTLIISYVMLILGELVPKNIAIHHSESMALRVARPIILMARIATPAVAFLSWSTNMVLRLFGIRENAVMTRVTEDEIISMVDAGEEEGVIPAFEGQMIRSVFDFGDTVVREVMVPRIDIVAVERDTPLHDALNLFLKLGFSRLPVYEDTVDNIVGILYAKDLLRYFHTENRPEEISSLYRQPLFVPETKRLSELIRELQQSRTQMAIAVDEYGGTAGLVTMEDMLEEIVGEIRDEYDHEESRLDIISESEVVASGLVSIGDLAETLDVELDVPDVDTVGGVVYAALGRIPLNGDVVELEELRITVEKVAGRRVRQVRVVRKPEPDLDEQG